MQQLNEQVADDVVSDVLTSLHVRSTVYCRSELRAPWGFGIRARDASVFHLVTEGRCWLEVDGVDEQVELAAGDMVLLMTGRAHRMRDDPASSVEWLDEILSRVPVERSSMDYGGSGTYTELVCGGFLVEGAEANPLVLEMPPFVRIEADDGVDGRWLSPLLDLLRIETGEPRPGSDAVLARLADILLTQAVRTYLLSLADADHPQVAAMRDPRIAKAIRLVQADPAHDWTVEEIAAEVAMSRSSFASQFRQLTGESPMRYMTRCRLARAASGLARDAATLSEIARDSGYDSEASFTRAFSRAFGMAPGAYRRRLNESLKRSSFGAFPEVAENDRGAGANGMTIQ